MKPATGCILRTIGIEIALIFLALAIYTGGESDIPPYYTSFRLNLFCFRIFCRRAGCPF